LDDFHEQLYMFSTGPFLHWSSHEAFGMHPAPSLHDSHLPVSLLHLPRAMTWHSWSHDSLIWVHDGSLAGSHGEHFPVPTSHLACGFPQVAAQKAAVLQPGDPSSHFSHFLLSWLHLAWEICFSQTSLHDSLSGNCPSSVTEHFLVVKSHEYPLQSVVLKSAGQVKLYGCPALKPPHLNGVFPIPL